MFNFSVLLELLTSRKAVEKDERNQEVTLYNQLNKKGMFTDVKKLIVYALKVTTKIFRALRPYVYFKLELEVSY